MKTDSFSLGANSITAVFAGTTSDLKSTSAAKSVMVTGKNQTTASLQGYVTGTDFWLPATLRAYGSGTPTGDADYLHIFDDSTIGTKPLSDAKWKNDLSIGSTPAVGKGALGIVAGDFNGDGFVDLATSNDPGIETTGGPLSVSVVLANGDGSFQPSVSYPLAGGSIYATPVLYTADFNNDGKLDLAVVNYRNGAVDILFGNGDGTFQSGIEFGSEFEVQSLFIGDFNRDGNLDIVLQGEPESDNNSLGVLLGNGDGTFQSQKNYSVQAGACCFNSQDVTGGDLNGDGVLDLAVTTNSGVVVLLGKGDGSFSAPTVFSGLLGAYLALADLNGDGKLDVVVTGLAGQISASLGKGDGTFAAPQSYSVAGFGYTPVVADINQDGKLDIAIEQSSTDGIQIFYGNGDGSFQPAVGYLPNQRTSATLIAGDFNGDGRPDLADPSFSPSQANIILNGQSTDLLLAKQKLGPGTTTVQTSYPGDADFNGNVSNKVVLTPNGTPPPAYAAPNYFLETSALVFNGTAAISNADGALSLTTGLMNQAGSVFYAAPQNIQAFTTDFQYTILSKGGQVADGLTFTIQNSGPPALGSPGGGLGYKGIIKSVAVKFDLFNNSGEGNASVGLYTDGASPELPAVILSGTGITLTAIVAHVVYDGTTLTLTIYDPAHQQKKFSHSWTIDIPATVGGPTAYVGFTGGTGGQVSEIQLLTWKYAPTTP